MTDDAIGRRGRARLHAAVLLVVLVASAFLTPALMAGAEVAREVLFLLIAVAMLAGVVRG